MQTAREIKRLDSTARSPIYAHFSETLNGTVTVRAYNDQWRFMAKNAERVNKNLTAYFCGTR